MVCISTSFPVWRSRERRDPSTVPSIRCAGGIASANTISSVRSISDIQTNSGRGWIVQHSTPTSLFVATSHPPHEASFRMGIVSFRGNGWMIPLSSSRRKISPLLSTNATRRFPARTIPSMGWLCSNLLRIESSRPGVKWTWRICPSSPAETNVPSWGRIQLAKVFPDAWRAARVSGTRSGVAFCRLQLDCNIS